MLEVSWSGKVCRLRHTCPQVRGAGDDKLLHDILSLAYQSCTLKDCLCLSTLYGSSMYIILWSNTEGVTVNADVVPWKLEDHQRAWLRCPGSYAGQLPSLLYGYPLFY